MVTFIWCLFCSWHCSKGFTCNNLTLTTPLWSKHIAPILQSRKLMQRVAKPLARGHMANKWWIWDMNVDSLPLEFVILTVLQVLFFHLAKCKE